MAMSLADWRAHRDALEEAIRQLSLDATATVSLGDRSFTRLSLGDLNKQMALANKRINDLEAGHDTLFSRTVRMRRDYGNLDAEELIWG